MIEYYEILVILSNLFVKQMISDLRLLMILPFNFIKLFNADANTYVAFL